MKHIVRVFLASLLTWWVAAIPAVAQDYVRTTHIDAALVADKDVVAPGDTVYVALHKLMDPEWHTYWRNPGDSGEKTVINWTLPLGAEAGDILWPTPSHIWTGPILQYGYGEELYLITPITIPQTAEPGTDLRFDADAFWLECADICIPGQVQLSLTLMVGEESVPSAIWSGVIQSELDRLPKPTDGVEAGAQVVDGRLEISMAGDAVSGDDIRDPYFYPFDNGAIQHSEPQDEIKGTGGYTLISPAGFRVEQGVTDPFSGVVAFEQNINGSWVRRGIEITAEPGAAVDIGDTVSQRLSSTDVAGSEGSAAVTDSHNWAVMMGLALLGGLILNLMPCVFPVIAIKALHLTKTAHSERGEARAHGVAYLVGVLFVFMLLAGLLVFLKSLGIALGWGFQMQNPLIVSVLALLIFAIGLNLAGLFEFGQGLQGVGDSLTAKSGKSGAFFTGALVVFVAAPCIGPLLGASMGWAMTQPALVTLIWFLFMGLGLAVPFFLLSMVPALGKILPKPGPWMETFKKAMAFPMFLAAIWLAWVVGTQTGATGLMYLLAAALCLAFALWAMQSHTRLGKVACVVLVLAALPLMYIGSQQSAGGVAIEANDNFIVEPWSEARVQELRAEGHPVFVDFTASWCVTCQANKITAISRKETEQAFADNNVALLIADWTNRDDEIAATLERFGRAGVPLYLMYPPGNEDVSPQILPQVLSVDIIVEAVEQAASR